MARDMGNLVITPTRMKMVYKSFGYTTLNGEIKNFVAPLSESAIRRAMITRAPEFDDSRMINEGCVLDGYMDLEEYNED